MSISATRYVKKFFTRGTGIILRFWEMVGGFIFGPSPQVKYPFEDLRLLNRLITEKKGILIIPGLMDLFGWDYFTAEREITRILIDFGGDIGVTNEGVIAYRFKTHASGDIVQPVPPASVRLKKYKKPFFDCPRFFTICMLAVLIPGFLGQLLHPNLVLFPVIQDYINLSTQYWDSDKTISLIFFQGLGGYIYLFPLGIPLVRSIFFLFYSIFKCRKMKYFDIIHKAITHPESFYFSQMSTALLTRLKGTIDETKMNKRGEYFYVFPELALEQGEAATLRKMKLD